MLISIAIPCYCSINNLRSVVDEIRGEFAKRPQDDYRILLICDGSPDRTDELIRKLCEEDSKITGILLSRNFTQNNARFAAVPYFEGDALVYMDDDGQHPAEGIFQLAEKIREGSDVVYAHLTEKKYSKFRILTSDINRRINISLGLLPKEIEVSSFFALSPFSVDKLREYDSPNPNMGAYLLSQTTKFSNVEIEQRERLSGKSGYTLKKLFELAITGYTNFTVIPLRIADYTGAAAALLGFIYGIIVLIRRLVARIAIPGYASIVILLLIIGGMILVSLGLLGEYVGRIYISLSSKPQYTIRETIKKQDGV